MTYAAIIQKAGKPAFNRDGNAPAMNRAIDAGTVFVRVEGIDEQAVGG